MKWNALAGQSSSLCKALSVIGDRWTLLILNQCFLKLRRYGEIQSSLGLSKPLLAARLKKMVRLGVLNKVHSRESARVHEYLLTEKGRQLYPVLLALVRWGNASKHGLPSFSSNAQFPISLRAKKLFREQLDNVVVTLIAK